MTMLFTRRFLLAGTAAALASSHFAFAAKPASKIEKKTLTLYAPDGRAIAVTQWQPMGKAKGVIAFSHGAMSAPWYYEAMIHPWVEAGYAVLAPLHVDSNEHPETKKYPGLASWRTRLEDMHVLSTHIGKRPYVATGHSYGGLVALTLGGASSVRPDAYNGPMADKKVKAVIAFSPPSPVPVLVTAEGYGTVAVPAIIQTGTLDIVPGMQSTADAWSTHLVAYDASAAGGHRYALAIEGVDHYFGGAICRFDLPGPKQLAQLDTANSIAGLFLKAYGSDSKKARRQLDARLSDNFPVRLQTK